ncbi:hypothetical protein [Paenibacillus sp. NPDC058174]|uniref:hypothetical protein n=1 Tax=Paenibacillus sp. NPDC058174 TaxID=3346366 RepID=UPI0036D8E7A9
MLKSQTKCKSTFCLRSKGSKQRSKCKNTFEMTRFSLFGAFWANQPAHLHFDAIDRRKTASQPALLHFDWFPTPEMGEYANHSKDVSRSGAGTGAGAEAVADEKIIPFVCIVLFVWHFFAQIREAERFEFGRTFRRFDPIILV